MSHIPNTLHSDLIFPLQLVVTAASRAQIQTAHRMVNRVCFEVSTNDSVPFPRFFSPAPDNRHQKSRPHRVPLLVGALAGPKSTADSSDGPYALFPFVSAGPSPWTMGDANTQRIRKVGGWSPLAESDRQSPNQPIIGFQRQAFQTHHFIVILIYITLVPLASST